ncbi:hypothetical protein [Christensenella minuta]|uniref:Lipoprotein n=1 Tax=Christensenella minuta TaxID=626937 RepID=A0A136Q0Y9_9FIRM|nr:hypothetical protein [Christensenella minuta]KXK64358.1 hypothetical protein HMPREF3293_03013 [Christensenella minuta]MDY3750674.1 hypothetical protein [Christensenella minuta]
MKKYKRLVILLILALLPAGCAQAVQADEQVLFKRRKVLPQ